MKQKGFSRREQDLHTLYNMNLCKRERSKGKEKLKQSERMQYLILSTFSLFPFLSIPVCCAGYMHSFK